MRPGRGSLFSVPGAPPLIHGGVVGLAELPAIVGYIGHLQLLPESLVIPHGNLHIPIFDSWSYVHSLPGYAGSRNGTIFLLGSLFYAWLGGLFYFLVGLVPSRYRRGVRPRRKPRVRNSSPRKSR